MYSSNMYKGIGVYSIIIKRFFVFEVIVFGFLNVVGICINKVLNVLNNFYYFVLFY